MLARGRQRRIAVLALVVGVGLGAAPGRAEPATDGAAAAEALVRAVWYEGLPPERARALDAAGVARLAALLADPDEAVVHANALLALGLSGRPDAFAPLAAYAARAPRGEVDRDTFRARTWLPLAMGHLAAHDPRALAWLLDAARRDPQPAWHFRHQRGARLGRLLGAQRLGALAWSGAPEAASLLSRARAAARAAGDVQRQRDVETALARLERVQREGADAVLDGERAAWERP